MRVILDLRERHRQPEQMDQEGLDPGAHRQALLALRRVNGLSLGVAAVWPYIQNYCRARREQGLAGPVRLLDLASGGGDFAIRLARRARREGLDLAVSGCDRSEFAVSHATAQAAGAGVDVSYFQLDVLSQPLPEGYDILTCSLFLHHLDEAEAIALLAAMRMAAPLVLVDDLIRSSGGWALAYAGIRILSRSSVAHFDGPRSVEGAFTCDEVRELAIQAGWSFPEIHRRWPCRFLLIGKRP
jgi:2-polyprenyl-3-methyl-5-hydroxy-6-metoxy-1,4-benzoquinol methylase